MNNFEVIVKIIVLTTFEGDKNKKTSYKTAKIFFHKYIFNNPFGIYYPIYS